MSRILRNNGMGLVVEIETVANQFLKIDFGRTFEATVAPAAISRDPLVRATVRPTR